MDEDVKEPAVIKFAFKNLRTSEKDGDQKWSATCKHCSTVLTEKFRTTSAFTK